MREFELLKFFVRNPYRVYDRLQLLDLVWGQDVHVEPRTVDVHIRRLRKRIERDDASPELIVTVRGVGYKFNDQTRWSRRLALQFLVPALAALAGTLVVAAPWLWTRLERREIDTLRERLTIEAALVGESVPWADGAHLDDTCTRLSHRPRAARDRVRDRRARPLRLGARRRGRPRRGPIGRCARRWPADGAMRCAPTGRAASA